MDWQPIETAPRDGEYFLAVCGPDCGTRNHWIVCWNGCCESFECGLDAEGLFARDVGTVACLSHWMPLPPPPTQADVTASAAKETPDGP